jgi:hypothetical protein
MSSRVCTAPDPLREAREALDEFDADRTARELSRAVPDDAVVCVLGWPELVAEALPARGDLDVLVVDVAGEGSGLVRRLRRSDVDASDVPLVGLGAAAAAADLVILEAACVGPEAFVAVAGSRAAAAVARHAGVDVWLVAGVGRFLPRRVWEVIEGRLDESDEPWELDDDVVPLDLVSSVCGPRGLESVEAALRRVDCPIAPELFKEGVL